MSIFSFAFLKWIHGEVLFLRGGRLKLEMNLRPSPLKFLPYTRPAKGRLWQANWWVSSVHISKWWKRTAKRLISQFLQLYDLWLMFVYKPCLLPKWVWGSMSYWLQQSAQSSHLQSRDGQRTRGFVHFCLDSCIMLFHSKRNQLSFIFAQIFIIYGGH